MTKRHSRGQAFTSSPWASGDKIFCLNEDGVTFVIRAGKEFEILHTNALAEDDMCMATPAIVGDRLLIRTAARIYCIRKGATHRRPDRSHRNRLNRHPSAGRFSSAPPIAPRTHARWLEPAAARRGQDASAGRCWCWPARARARRGW